MSNKAAATWHGAPCNGECCKTHRGIGTCFHLRVCQHHLREQVREGSKKSGTGKAPRNLFAEAEALTGVRRS